MKCRDVTYFMKGNIETGESVPGYRLKEKDPSSLIGTLGHLKDLISSDTFSPPTATFYKQFLVLIVLKVRFMPIYSRQPNGLTNPESSQSCMVFEASRLFLQANNTFD